MATMLYVCGSIVGFGSWIFLIIIVDDDAGDDSAGVEETCLRKLVRRWDTKKECEERVYFISVMERTKKVCSKQE